MQQNDAKGDLRCVTWSSPNIARSERDSDVGFLFVGDRVVSEMRTATRRTSFHFPKQAIAQLNAIRERTRLDANSDVIRIALQAYDELLDLSDDGCSLFIIDKDGAEWEYSPYKKCLYPRFGQLENGDTETEEKSVASNFFFSGEAASRLESIKARSYAKTSADAIRLALTSYKELILADEDGCAIMVRDSNGVEAAYNPYRPFRWQKEHLELLR